MLELILTDADNQKTVKVPAGSQVRIRLKENPTTGYQWSLRPLAAGGLALTSDRYLASQGGGVGGGGTREFVFSAESPGEATIELKLVRAWESKPTPAATFKIIAQIE